MLYRNIIHIVTAIVLCFSFSVSAAEKLQLVIETADGKPRGTVTIGLLSEQAPNHVARIKRLTNEGLYNGVVFHRVIHGFMAQTGDVQYGNVRALDKKRVGTGSSSYDDLKAELSETPFTPGVVGMARSRYIHSANSQFFIMTETHSGLNGAYTVIGLVLEGLDIVRQIQPGPQSHNGQVGRPDVIKKAVIIK